MIKCLIFDLDGTLFKNDEANYVSYKKAFEEIGVNISKKLYQKLYGLRSDIMLKRLYPKITENEIKLVKERKSFYYRKNIKLISINNDLINLIKYFKNTHKIALATTASRINAEFLLDHFKVKNLFDHIIYGEDVKKGKPNPECYLNCIKRCGVKANECLVFEDSKYGIESANLASTNTIKVVF